MPEGKAGEALKKKYFKVEEWQKQVNTDQTSTLKAMSDYTGIAFSNLEHLPYSVYLLYRHDAWVANTTQSEEGQKFIKACLRLQKKDADVKAVREFNKERGR